MFVACVCLNTYSQSRSVIFEAYQIQVIKYYFNIVYYRLNNIFENPIDNNKEVKDKS